MAHDFSFMRVFSFVFVAVAIFSTLFAFAYSSTLSRSALTAYAVRDSGSTRPSLSPENTFSCRISLDEAFSSDENACDFTGPSTESKRFGELGKGVSVRLIEEGTQSTLVAIDARSEATDISFFSASNFRDLEKDVLASPLFSSEMLPELCTNSRLDYNEKSIDCGGENSGCPDCTCSVAIVGYFNRDLISIFLFAVLFFTFAFSCT
jgi:hypothetical protein